MPVHRPPDTPVQQTSVQQTSAQLAPPPALTVYYDGACPLCEAEIRAYKRHLPADRVAFVDVSCLSLSPVPDRTVSDLRRRFHVRTATGVTHSGARAFLEVWRHSPRLAPIARIAENNVALRGLEGYYRVFLLVRPVLGALARMLVAKRPACRGICPRSTEDQPET